ncbi:hypothetical protein D3C86_1795130 [compost metagenome]
MLQILDQQVRLDLGRVTENFLQRMVGPDRFGGDFDALAAQQLGLVLEPLAVFLQVTLAGFLLDALVQQREGRERLDEGGDMQRGPAGSGQGAGALQPGRMAHVAVGDEKQALILTHEAPPRIPIIARDADAIAGCD